MARAEFEATIRGFLSVLCCAACLCQVVHMYLKL